MTYRLGVDIGTTFTAAAVSRCDEVTMVHLGNRTDEMETAIAFPSSGDVLFGAPAVQRGLVEADVLAREFKRRIGDPIPIVLGGTPRSPESLMATMLRHVGAAAESSEGAPPAEIVLTYPASWGPYKQAQLEQIVQLSGYERAQHMTEPEAAARHYVAQGRVRPGEIVAVFDFGGGTFDAAVIEHTLEGSFRMLGEASGIERLGGVDLDHAVFDFVVSQLSLGEDELDLPENRAALVRLRADCTAAKEALSTDNVADIPVMFDGSHTEVRLTRQEFEDMIRPNVLDAIETIDRTVRSAKIDGAELSSILLVGGTSRIPLVSEMVTAHFDRPTLVDAHPKHSIAAGAASALRTESDNPGTAAAPAVSLDGERTPAESSALTAAAAETRHVLLSSIAEPTDSTDREEATPLSQPQGFEADGRPHSIRRLFAVGVVVASIIVGLFALSLSRDDGTVTTEAATAESSSESSAPEVEPPTTAETDAPPTTSETEPPRTTSSTEAVAAGDSAREQPSLAVVLEDATGLTAWGAGTQVLGSGSRGPVTPPQLKWQLAADLFTGPVPLGDMVFHGPPGESGLPFLTAVDAATGAVAWVDDRPQVGTILVTDGAVLNQWLGGVRVLDPETGERIGEISLPSNFGSGTVIVNLVQLVNGSLLVAGGYGDGPEAAAFALRFDLESGDVVWTYEDVASGWSQTDQTIQFLSDGTTAILATSDATAALDVASGETLWRSLDLTGTTAMHLDAGVLITWPGPGENVALDARTSDRLWEFAARTAAAYASDGDQFYVIVEGKTVQARRLTTGDVVWTAGFVGGGATTPTTLAIGDDLLYVVDDSGAAAAIQRANGELVWSSTLESMNGGSFLLPVSAGNGRLFVLQDSTVRAYE